MAVRPTACSSTRVSSMQLDRPERGFGYRVDGTRCRHRRPDAVSDRAAVVGLIRGLRLRAGRHARRCDGPPARRRHPVRRGARRHLRPDRRRRDVLRAAVVGGVRDAQHVAGGGPDDLPGHLAGDLLHQGPRRGQRPERRGRAHRATGTAGHRADRRGAVGRAVPARAVAAACRRMVAGGGQPDHPGSARAHRAHLAGRDGAAAEGPNPMSGIRATRGWGHHRTGRTSDRHPGGTTGDWGQPLLVRGPVSDLGYAAGWRVVRAMPELVARNAFDAGAIYASRNGGPAAAAQEPGACPRRDTRQRCRAG